MRTRRTLVSLMFLSAFMLAAGSASAQSGSESGPELARLRISSIWAPMWM